MKQVLIDFDAVTREQMLMLFPDESVGEVLNIMDCFSRKGSLVYYDDDCRSPDHNRQQASVNCFWVLLDLFGSDVKCFKGEYPASIDVSRNGKRTSIIYIDENFVRKAAYLNPVRGRKYIFLVTNEWHIEEIKKLIGSIDCSFAVRDKRDFDEKPNIEYVEG